MFIISLLTILFLPADALASSGGAYDPFSLTLLSTSCILLAAALGRAIAEKCNQPPVLGELLFGIVIGTIGYQAGFPIFVLIMHGSSAAKIHDLMIAQGLSLHDAVSQIVPVTDSAYNRITAVLSDAHANAYMSLASTLSVFSNLGVILLLFMVGLESSVGEMAKVGKNAFLVAVLGVVAPFVLSLLVTKLVAPDLSFTTDIFLAAAVCATSVGITARVFKDMKFMQTIEAKTVLGAAVIDDILGLILLAIVVGIVTTGEFSMDSVVTIFVSSTLFLAAILLMGEKLVKLLIPIAKRIDAKHTKILVALVLAFGISYFAALIGLASIVGAFAAGLIIKNEFFSSEAATDPANESSVEALIAPLEQLFAPVFFVLMGMQVDVTSFLKPETLLLAAVFTVAGVVGKLISGYGAAKGSDRLAVGIGMIPRGEVGLIFASIGLSLGVVNGSSFAALICMVVVTTFLTPILLGLRLKSRSA